MFPNKTGTKSRHVSNQDSATERKYINIIIILAGNKLSCPKLVSECHAELHVTLSIKHDGDKIIVISEHVF